MEIVENLMEIEEKYTYDIELGLQNNSGAIPIKEAKDQINESCKKRGFTNIPKTK